MPDDTTTAAPAAAPPPADPPADPAPAPASSDPSQDPSTQSTSAPASSDPSQDPSTQSTSAPASSDPSQSPGVSTTAAPSQATTAPAGPSIQASIQIDPDDGSPQNPNSYQVAASAKLVLNWTATNAASVNITGVGDGQGASGSATIPTQDGNITLVAIGNDGTQSTPFSIDIATHPDGDVVSGHSDLSSGVAMIVSFSATKDGQTITTANFGDQIVLTAVVSESTDACTIDGADVSLSDDGNGNKQGTSTVTLAVPMSGDFSCTVSAGGTAGAPGNLHIDIGTAAGTTTTAAPNTAQPGTTTTASSSAQPVTTTTQAPPTAATTQPVGTSTTAPPANTSTAQPATTTTAHPTGTTTEVETEDGQPLYSFTQPLKGIESPEADHYSLSLVAEAKVSVLWQGSGDKPEKSSLTGDEQSALDNALEVNAGWSCPIWDAIKKGGEWKAKDYSSFWDHITGFGGVDQENKKNEKTGEHEQEVQITVASYEFGEVTFGAVGSEPALTISVSLALAGVNVRDLKASGLGVLTGTYEGTILSAKVDVGPIRLKFDIGVTLTATLTAVTLEEIGKAIGENPFAAAAVALVICAVGMIYVLEESPSYDELLDLRNAAQNLGNKTAAAYISGLQGNGGTDGASQAGAQARTKFFSDMRAQNPNATDDDITAALNNQVPDLTTKAQAYFLPQAQDAVWNAWAKENSGGLKQIAVTSNQAILAWQSVYPGAPYENDARFTHYFQLSENEQRDAAANNMTPDQRLAAWKAWVVDNTHWYGDENRSVAQANYESIMKRTDYDQDPDYLAHWG